MLGQGIHTFDLVKQAGVSVIKCETFISYRKMFTYTMRDIQLFTFKKGKKQNDDYSTSPARFGETHLVQST